MRTRHPFYQHKGVSSIEGHETLKAYHPFKNRGLRSAASSIMPTASEDTDLLRRRQETRIRTADIFMRCFNDSLPAALLLSLH